VSLELETHIIEKIRSVMRGYTDIKHLVLFGSRAKGSAKNGSDIDLAIVGNKIGFRELCKLGAKLDELDLPYKIDIINYDSITNQELKEHIDRVGIELFSSSSL
jgi:predicted nucleotidyltransferase